MELEFISTYDKKIFIKEKIDYFVRKYGYRSYEININRINLLYILYNAYRNGYKDLINNLSNELKKSYKSEKNNELSRLYINLLNKFKKIIKYNNKQFKSFINNLDLDKSINAIFHENGNNKVLKKRHYINLIKYIQENRNNTIFENTANIIKLLFYSYKITGKQFSIENYNLVIEKINIIKSLIFGVVDIYNINYTEKDEDEQAKYMLKKIIYNKVPKNKKELYDNFIYIIYFKFRNNGEDLYKILDNIKLDIVKEDNTLQQTDYYLKYADSLKYYYSKNFYLRYIIKSKENITKFIKLFIYGNDDIFKIGIIDTINKYKDTILNDILPNLPQDIKIKLLKESILNIDNITDKKINKEISKQNKETNQTEKLKTEIKLIKQLMYREILDNLQNYKLFNTKNLNNIKTKLYKIYESLYQDKSEIIEIELDYLLDNYDNISLNNLEILLIYGYYNKYKIKDIIKNKRITFNRYLYNYYINEEDIHATQTIKQRIDKLDNLEFGIFTEISLLKEVA